MDPDRLAGNQCKTNTFRSPRSMGETIVKQTVPACPAGTLPETLGNKAFSGFPAGNLETLMKRDDSAKSLLLVVGKCDRIA